MNSMSLALRQLLGLTAKNWLVLRRHWVSNLFRCLLLPVAYGIFVSLAQLFLVKPSVLGIGDPVPVLRLADAFPSDGSLSLVYTLNSSIESGLPDRVIDRVIQSLSPAQREHVVRVDSLAEVDPLCKQNFNGFSECFAAAIFGPADNGTVDYTIRADQGLFYVDVKKHRSDFEKRILPLQWAIDEAIIALTTNATPPIPLEWPFTNESQEEQALRIRLNFIEGIVQLFVIALILAFIGVPYYIAGPYVTERASGMSSLMATMGCGVVPRYLSYHLSITLAYLPGWVLIGFLFHYRLYKSTSLGVVVGVHILLGLILAVYALFLSVPFAKSPALASIFATFVPFILAIGALVLSSQSSNTTASSCIFTLIFPPGFYVFAIRSMSGWERELRGEKIGSRQLSTPDPQSGLVLGAFIGVAIVVILVYPVITMALERFVYEPTPVSGSRKTTEASDLTARDSDVAIKIHHLSKVFQSKWSLLKREKVTAIEDLTLDIPRFGIFVLLGSNGAGKSTLMSILTGKTKASSGSAEYLHPTSSPIGVVPQKNVLIDELTCIETIQLFCTLKGVQRSDVNQAAEQLLVDVGLSEKRDALVNSLSGGMKRKLQLSLGLAGNSDYIFIDECTSGVDPLSRRSLWRAIMAYRTTKTIVFTTHFLDEADLLADSLAVLAIPGKLRAFGTPVSLKTNVETGYKIHVVFGPNAAEAADGGSKVLTVLSLLREVASEATVVEGSSLSSAAYALHTSDLGTIARALDIIERLKQGGTVANYDISGPNLDDVFQFLMHDPEAVRDKRKDTGSDFIDAASKPPLNLQRGIPPSMFSQIITVFRKRVLILRRAWLSPLLMVGIAVAGCCIPLFFMKGRRQSCTPRFEFEVSTSLYLSDSPLATSSNNINGSNPLLESPEGITSTLPRTSSIPVRALSDNATFIGAVRDGYRNIAFGGISVDRSDLAASFAWEASAPSMTGPTLLNLASNLLWNTALNASGPSTPRLIEAHYQPFAAVAVTGLVAMKWMAFYGAAMAVFPAFFSLYVAKERRSDVQAMQYSNGLSHPLALWLGHLLFDSVFCAIIATVTIIVFATVSDQFKGLGLLWLVTLIYGMTGALFAYVVARISRSPLTAFAIVAGYQVLIFILYLSGYMLTLTYSRTSDSGRVINIMHYTTSLVAPVASVIRAALVSVNLFSLLCENNTITTSNMGRFSRYGGPLTYLILTSLLLLGVLVILDFGLGAFKIANMRRRPSNLGASTDKEKRSVAALDVHNVSKKFRRAKTHAVEDVSFEVNGGTVFALLGPNGAGKTTLFNIIRGELRPTRGDVFINEASITNSSRLARLSLGVCPQFTAIDSELTVREHLAVYGRLKGLSIKHVDGDVEDLLKATDLITYADRLASQLSGGNQRKLALAICLIGAPSVILVDEFSTGIDPRTKREMWETFERVSKGKAMVVTTHSMEEAAVLADKIGIMAGKLLLVGSVEELIARHGTYQVHFSTRTEEDVNQAKALMTRLKDSRMMDDVATRFEVNVNDDTTIASIFHVLHEHSGGGQYTVERGNLESIFLKVIREHNISDE